MESSNGSDRTDPDLLRVTRRRAGGLLEVAAAGELDISTVDRLALACADAGATTVVLDLRGVTFIDGSGLRGLVRLHEALEGRLSVIPSPACRRLFRLVDEIVTVPR